MAYFLNHRSLIPTENMAENAAGSSTRAFGDRGLHADVSQAVLVCGIDQPLDDHLERRPIGPQNDLIDKGMFFFGCPDR